MADNNFNKEERVAFENVLEGFNDQLVISQKVNKYNIGDVTAERANDTMWRPMPYILPSYDGMDQTANFNDKTQLAVPATIGFKKSVPFMLDASELRDSSQPTSLQLAASQRLASDINVSLMNRAASEGTVFVQRTGAATGYDDVAECDAAFNELGVDMSMRHMCLSSRDYNKMSGNLAARETMQGKPTRAYEKSFVGDVAGFETNKLDYANSLTAASGTTVTIAAASQNYTPQATSTSVGGQINVDNRYMTLSIAVGGGTVKVGDAFTIAGVNSVHHITKGDTGQSKTFRIIEILTGAGGTGTVKISPAIVATDDTPTQADIQYQNVTATPANGAAITFLNVKAASINPFWRYDAIELLPARYIMPSNSGLAVMRATTDQGIDVLMTRQGDINTLNVKYRFDVMYGTVMTNPEQAGLMMFDQT